MRAKRSILMCLCGSSILACSSAVPARSVQTRDPVEATIDSTVTRLMAAGASPGLGVVVVRDTQVLFMKVTVFLTGSFI